MAEQRQAKPVKNKDIQLLQKVNLLKLDVISLEKRAQWERDRLCNISQHLSSAGGGGTPHGMDEAFAAMSEAEERHRLLAKTYTQEIKKAERIIDSIASNQMRTRVTMRYLDNVADSAVRSVLHMSRWAYDSAKAAIENAECMAQVQWNDRYSGDA